jgi:hypothetical protein
VFPVASTSDFDFVVVETRGHRIGFFEAFYPETFAEVTTLTEEAVCVTYSQTIGAFLIATKTGCLVIVPHILHIHPL